MASHVYHWKHGWIPLTHTAALSKAKGNHAAAARMMADAPHAAGIQSRQDVAKAILDLGSIPPGQRGDAIKEIQVAARKHNAEDLLPAPIRPSVEREATAQAEQTAISAAHTVARERPSPSSADLSEAAQQWRRENPSKTIAGHESEVARIADDIWRRKKLKGQEGTTTAERRSEKARIRQASHGNQFKALGLDKPVVIPESHVNLLRDHLAAKRKRRG